EALRDINLVVPEGDFVFLVGPSGAGKSTLVRLLIREEKPTKGKIFVEGVELGR
ncbi:MAG TPA: cell division ATP-binding protein FtsE, partial [Chloroflexi bacterium]|nr:cell division ATP-binding protein FtsE [Chloroflexota bacterium]